MTRATLVVLFLVRMHAVGRCLRRSIALFVLLVAMLESRYLA